MNVNKYLGLKYDFRNKVGVNCWGLYALVLYKELNKTIETFVPKKCTTQDIAASFTAGFATHRHLFKKTENPTDFDLVMITKKINGKTSWHCGVFFGGKLLHAKGNERNGQVWYDDLKEYNNSTIRFYRYDH